MSENLDLVRSICAAWERGDYSSFEWAHPEGEFVIEDIPGSGCSKGVAAGLAAWREFLEAWEGHEIEVDEYRELDAGRVLMLGAFRARGKANGPMNTRSPSALRVFTLARASRAIWSPARAGCRRTSRRGTGVDDG